MSGHSKWHNIRQKKEGQDKQKSKVFTLHARLIFLAVQKGGVDNNPTLDEAIRKAKKDNVPLDNIQKAIKRGTGDDKQSAQIEEVVYEGYAPGGVGMLVKVLTENRNRTSSNIRHIFTKYGGNLAESGAVSSHLFRHVGLIIVDLAKHPLDTIEEIVIDSGAENYEAGDDNMLEITTTRTTLSTVRDFLIARGVTIEDASLQYVPNMTIEPESLEHAMSVIKMLDAFDSDDDVEDVWHNMDENHQLFADANDAIS